jgi:NADH-quinone oxidoreductase subunit E
MGTYSGPLGKPESTMAFALTPEREQQVDDIITRYPTRRAALIPVLWVCQKQNSWISPDVIDYVSARLDISAAAVKGVVTFYTMFHEHEVGENVVWVCRTLSCDLRGAKAVQEHLEERFGCHAGGTSTNGKFSLFKAECLAACGQGPMIQINDRYFENLDLTKLDEILNAYEKDGVDAAEKRYADTAIYNGHVPPPGMEPPPPRASLPPAATRPAAPAPARPASVPPPAAARPASVAPPARPASVAPPAVSPPPAATPSSRPAPKATLVGMPAVTATPTPSNPPPAETSSASAPPSDDDAKKGEE